MVHFHLYKKGCVFVSGCRKSLDICAERKRGFSDLELLCEVLDQVNMCLEGIEPIRWHCFVDFNSTKRCTRFAYFKTTFFAIFCNKIYKIGTVPHTPHEKYA